MSLGLRRPECLRVPVKARSGERFFYSPLHRRITWRVEATPWGGFLAEEMVRCTSSSHHPSPAKSISDTLRNPYPGVYEMRIPV